VIRAFEASRRPADTDHSIADRFNYVRLDVAWRRRVEDEHHLFRLDHLRITAFHNAALE
jgi:hypothetical protein